MHPYTFSFLVMSVSLFFLAGFVLNQDPRKKLFRLFALYSFSASLWGAFNFVHTYTRDERVGRIFAHALHLPVTFIPVLFLHFVMVFLNDSSRLSRRWLKAAYLIAAAYTPLVLTPWMIRDITSEKYGVHFLPAADGFFYPSYVAVFAAHASYGLFLLYRAYKSSSGVRKNQLRYLFFGTLVGYVGGVDGFLVVFGINIYPLFPYGAYAVVLYTFLTAYAIVAHHLLDIEVVIRRTAVFAGIFAFIYGVFAVSALLGREFFNRFMAWNEWLTMLPTVLVLTFALRPLETFLTDVTDRFLFQKKYDYQELLRTFTNEVLTILDLQKLADRTVAALVRIVKLESAALVVRDREQGIYRIAASHGVAGRDVTFGSEDALVRHLDETNQPFLKEKVSARSSKYAALHESLRRLNARLCLPVALQGELIGLLSMGMKKSGEDYNAEDIEILQTLARTEAIAISNAELLRELSKTQAEAAQREKMAVIGTLAAGINHEITAPLSIVRGHCELFLLNLRDGHYKAKSPEELTAIFRDIASKAIQETDRATSISSKLTHFAKPSGNTHFERTDLYKEVSEVLDLIGQDLRMHEIEVEMGIAAGFPSISADRKQVQEVFFNLLRNAGQAIDKKGGCVRISAEAADGQAVVRISDNGSGIPPDRIARIFDPFYTTKSEGKGTGLGLFIVRQVVERNRGKISVESRVGEGTTFTLSFPLHPAQS